MECERGIEKNILPLAEILDADVHRRLRYIAIFGILEVIDARLFEELVSVVQGELLLAVIRNYLVGHKIDLVKMPVEEIGDRLERIVGECIVGVEIGYILTLRVLDTEISRCRNAAVFEREHLEDIMFSAYSLHMPRLPSFEPSSISRTSSSSLLMVCRRRLSRHEAR